MNRRKYKTICQCYISITLIGVLFLLSAGFQPSIRSLEVTNGFIFPIKVYYGQIYRGETQYHTDTVIEVTHTYETYTSTSTIGLYIIPLQLNPGQSGRLKFTVDGTLFSCSRNEKQDFVITAENEIGEIVYRETFSLLDFKAMDYKLLIGGS